ncbi:hypothetical protein QFC19_008070 [Naganishia cerealis]|uniref:Uncharacterized protein n=1 Tax=Naganishia cerealis TaxID=610337 RepID=A0ACC2V438_9TREE|nr:hypothetical protein QFC19_008070 [Naganishia cerealis]
MLMSAGIDNPSEVSNPKLMVIVGSFGLLSNIVGLFLFHDTDENAEASTGGRPGLRRERSDSFGSLYGHPALTRAAVIETAQEFGYGRSPPAKGTRDSFNMAFSPTGPEDSIHGAINPITHHSRSKGAQAKRTSVSPPDETSRLTNGQPISYAAVVKKNTKADDNGSGHDHSHDHGSHGNTHSHAEDHSEAEAGGHSHSHGGHGHSHGSMNAQGVFLHVLGDALGNVGVIAAGLVIWFAKGYWRFYFDPAISLFITVIIFHSALPLDTDYMAVADNIRKVLHEYGVHSVTIQPEFADDAVDNSDTDSAACLIRCPPEAACGGDTCCPPVTVGKLVDVDNVDGHDDHSH